MTLATVGAEGKAAGPWLGRASVPLCGTGVGGEAGPRKADGLMLGLAAGGVLEGRDACRTGQSGERNQGVSLFHVKQMLTGRTGDVGGKNS